MKCAVWAVLAVAIAVPSQASVFATNLVTATNSLTFGTGLVTGAPDSGGIILGNTFDPPALQGSIIVSFASALGNGAGADLRIYDIGNSANETFNVFVSSDNSLYTLLGEYSAINNLVDFGSFAGPVSFVWLASTATSVSADIDAVEGFYDYVAPPAVPEPASWAMIIGGLALTGAAMRHRKTVVAFA